MLLWLFTGQKFNLNNSFNINKAGLHISIIHRHSNEQVYGVHSTEEEPMICKERLFLILKDVTKDHDSVLHIVKFISVDRY